MHDNDDDEKDSGDVWSVTSSSKDDSGSRVGDAGGVEKTLRLLLSLMMMMMIGMMMMIMMMIMVLMVSISVVAMMMMMMMM